MKKPALFLDRDGVINVDHGYVHTPEHFDFIDGIFELVATAKKRGYFVVVITNQAGIGRGYYSEMQLRALTDWMKARFNENGGQIDAVYFCPYHPEHGNGSYRCESEFRKPAPGMLFQAQRDLDIDLNSSILIGDKPTDVEAGRAAGVGKLFLLGTIDAGTGSSTIAHLSEVLPYLAINPANS